MALKELLSCHDVAAWPLVGNDCPPIAHFLEWKKDKIPQGFELKEAKDDRIGILKILDVTDYQVAQYTIAANYWIVH